MFKHTQTPDLELRLLDLRHADELFALTDANRAYLRQWLPWVDFTESVADTRTFIETTMKQFASSRGFQAGIWYQGKLVGVIGYHGYSASHRFTSIGYWLAEAYQGKGIMTQACGAFVDYAFRELQLNRVEIQCAVDNSKSRAIPERLGFQQEGVVRKVEWLYDHFVDHVIYGMLAEEWK